MNQSFPKRNGRIIAQFSCGAASAVATKLAIAKYGDAVEIYRQDTGSEHPDNERFQADCEKWFGKTVNVIRSETFADHFDVCEQRRYLSGVGGAPCTGELKKKPFMEVWQLGDVEVFGYTANERGRIERWRKNNTERIIECPLIDHNLSKADCFGMLDRAGIEIPMMYKLGFRNANCIACVKARDSVDYWRRTRKHFPQQFERMAALERTLGHAINRESKGGLKTPIFLDEIPPGDPVGADPDIQCGLFCMAESENLNQ